MRMNGRGAESGRPPRRPFVVAHGPATPCSAYRPPRRSGSRRSRRTSTSSGAHGSAPPEDARTDPLLWDRWRLANPFRRRLVLAELLAAVDGRTELVLDQGTRPPLAKGVAEALAPRRRAGGHTTVCARHGAPRGAARRSRGPARPLRRQRASAPAPAPPPSRSPARGRRSTSGCSTRGLSGAPRARRRDSHLAGQHARAPRSSFAWRSKG